MAKARTQRPPQLQSAVDEIVGELSAVERFGKLANHVEGLGDIETGRFGIAVITANGKLVQAGEADHAFPLQSISKVFALTLALKAFGDDIFRRVGREPSGDPFNSIVDLERQKGIPRNPFINSGALVVCDILLDRTKEKRDPDTVRDFLIAETGEKAFGTETGIIRDDGKSSGFGNRAHANLAKFFDNLHHDVEAVMKRYVEQCAICLSCRQLALAGRYLMRGGREPDSDDARLARRVNALMMTCGMYDGAGDFASRIGLPAKSGVGGGILAIAPGIASIAVWSPSLDDKGNSILGSMALERLSEKMGWSVFG